MRLVLFTATIAPVIAIACQLYCQILSSANFPIPREMKTDKDFVGSRISARDQELLRRAIVEDLGPRQGEGTLTLQELRSTSISLGSLGQGVLVKAKDGSQTLCGATGNCPIWLYIRVPTGYRQVLGQVPDRKSVPYQDVGASGWAYGLLDTDGIPDLIMATNIGGGQQALTRYRYSRGRFLEAGCETLTPKDPGGRDWFNAAYVDIAACKVSRDD